MLQCSAWCSFCNSNFGGAWGMIDRVVCVLITTTIPPQIQTHTHNLTTTAFAGEFALLGTAYMEGMGHPISLAVSGEGVYLGFQVGISFKMAFFCSDLRFTSLCGGAFFLGSCAVLCLGLLAVSGKGGRRLLGLPGGSLFWGGGGMSFR